MKHSLASLLLAGAALLPGSLATPARAATTILHSFTGGGSDGAYPFGSLTLSGSTLYGMNWKGGSSDQGTLFKVNTDGTGYSLLHSFINTQTDGSTPYGSLTLSGSKLYAMTQYGGVSNSGALFSVNTDGSGFSLVHSFANGVNDGAIPLGSLTLSGSKLYGATQYGGASNAGTLFSVNTDGTGFSLLHSFAGYPSDGAWPYGSLTLSGSKLFGMTNTGGGSNGGGVIFSMNTDGTGYSLLHTFAGGSADGASPYGSLTLSGSKLFGMTNGGGSAFGGVIFSLNTDGTGFTPLHTFVGGASDGVNPTGSLTLFGSQMYGMVGSIGGYGIIFTLNTDGSGFRLIESFTGTPSAAIPGRGDVTLSADGSTLYGMTSQGGTADKGTVFSTNIATPEPGTFALLGLGALLLSTRRRGRT